MAISTRTLLLGTIVALSLLLAFGYVYLNDVEKKTTPPTREIVLANGTKVVAKNENQAGKSEEKDHWHDKVKDKLQATTNLGFLHAFIASISVIVVSELGDKTFFIAAIMAMRHSRLIIYSGAMGALGAMTILSALLGNIVTKFVPRVYTYYLSSILFAGFGVKMLKDGYQMSPDEGAEEYKEVQQEVEEAEAAEDLEAGGDMKGGSSAERASPHQATMTTTSKQKGTVSQLVLMIRRYVSPILIQAFILTFLAVSKSGRTEGKSSSATYRNGVTDLK